MKKILSLLIICLTTISQIYSQTNLQTSDEKVIVPVSTLKNALIVLEQRNYCYSNLEIVRDSVTNLSEIIKNKDTVIFNQTSIIGYKDSIITNYDKIVKNKDSEIKIYKNLYRKEKMFKWGGFSGVIVLLGLLII
jgi:hypothetical protein